MSDQTFMNYVAQKSTRLALADYFALSINHTLAPGKEQPHVFRQSSLNSLIAGVSHSLKPTGSIAFEDSKD